MSRQQIRSSGDGAIDPSLVQKKRARHRLVGAICLCLIAAVVVPLVLESEPRPPDRTLPIEMAAPERRADEQPASTTGSHAPATAAADHATAQSTPQSAVKTVIPPGAGNPVAGSTRLPGAPGVGEPPRAEAGKADAGKGEGARTEAARAEAAKAEAARQQAAKQPPAKQEAAKQEAAKQEAAKQEAAKASGKTDPSSKPPAAQDKSGGRSGEPDVLARLIDRTAPEGPAAGGAAGAAGAAGSSGAAASRKYLVQIGAYSNVQSARTMSDRVVQVGLRPYQETVKTEHGDWIRVRVGPFTTRQDAERAQQDLKRAGVTAAIIAL